jgi:ferredoxin
MKLNADIVIVGSGTGGATVAKELAKKGKDVLVVERGPFVRSLGSQRSAIGFYDRCGLRTSKEGIIVYRTLMVGGTTVVSCGNGLPVLEKEFNRLGIDLSEYIEETKKELGIAPLPPRLIGRATQLIMNTGNKLGLDMQAMPKFIDPKKCISCGLCVLGCKTGAKWSAINFIEEMERCGGQLITGVDVKSIAIHNNKAIGLVAKKGQKKIRIIANKIVLSAGGFGSAVILRRSGIKQAGNKFFADLFSVTYGVLPDKDISLYKEQPMAIVSTKFLEKKGFIISPFIDVPLMLRWVMPIDRHITGSKYKNLLGIMVKIKDSSEGSVTEDEKFYKVPTKDDYEKLNEGASIARKIFAEIGIKKKNIFTTKPRAAHPGGSVAINEVVNTNLETKIKNLFVCDASVLPASPGAPPIVTIISLGKKLANEIT